METQVCTTCSGTGIMSQGTEWAQFCMDCVTGNALALKSCGSNLDPAKYPACHYDIDRPGCNDQGLFPDGTSCDCERCDILGFESSGMSHEVTIKVLATLIDNEYGINEDQRAALEQLWAIRDDSTNTPGYANRMTEWVEAHPDVVQDSLNHNWLRNFL